MKIELIEKYIQRILSESTPSRPIWNIEDVKSGRGLHWNYIDNCMMSALLRMHERTGDEKYCRFVCDFMDEMVAEDGSLLGYNEHTYNLDNIFGGNALMEVFLSSGREKYKKALNKLNSQLKNQPRTKEGNFWHKKIYPNQIWLDGLYMAQVYRCRWAKEFDDKVMCDDVINQFENVRKLMFDEDKKLYIHCYDSAKRMFWAQENGRSKNAWLRAIGWYAAALADVIELLPTDYDECRDWLSGILTELFDGMIQYLDQESGMFLQVVDYPREKGNYPETSGSALVGYSMMKSARLGFVDRKWMEQGKSLFNSICKKYLKEVNGSLSLGGICLVAGLGPEDNIRRDGTLEYYMSEPVVENEAKGIAPFLYCYAESLYTD